MKLQILLDKRAVLTKQIATLKHQQSHDQRKADTLTKIHLGEQVLEFLKTNQSATSKAYFIRGALYFDVTPNADSLKPISDFVERDIEHLLIKNGFQNTEGMSIFKKCLGQINQHIMIKHRNQNHQDATIKRYR